MKAFTTVMKLAIIAVTVALVAMLIVNAAPLVTGGVNIDENEAVNVSYTGTTVTIHGEYTIVSKMDQDISDLQFDVFLKSRDGSVTKYLVSAGPITINKDNPEVPIILDETINIAEIALFFITDNMDQDTEGLTLPVSIHVKGTYSNNLAGIDMTVIYLAPLSETGSFSVDPSKGVTTTDGEVSKAVVDLSGIGGDAINLIPDDGAKIELDLGGGKTLSLDISKSGDDVELSIETGDLDNDSIKSIIDAVLDAIQNEEDKDIGLTFVGEGGAETPFNFNPSDLASSDPAVYEQAVKMMEDYEAIMDSLDLFLDKYASMIEGGA